MHSDTSVFRTRAYSRAWFYLGLWAVACVYGLAVLFQLTQRDVSFGPFAALWVAVLAYNSVFLYRLLVRSRLEVSSWGIRYRHVRYDLEVPWSKVQELRTVRLPGFRDLRFLRVDGALITSNKLLDPLPHLDFMSTRDRIPLGPRVWEREDELMRRIRSYGPTATAAA